MPNDAQEFFYNWGLAVILIRLCAVQSTGIFFSIVLAMATAYFLCLLLICPVVVFANGMHLNLRQKASDLSGVDVYTFPQVIFLPFLVWIAL